MNRLPIAVCMVSGAEAERIGRALESVAGWTSEIIIVLNEEVRDGTEEVARKYGATVFREPWKGFRDQKNSAAAKAGAEWILGLDADEVVSPELREEVQRFFGEPQRLERYAAFSFPRLSWYCGRWIRHGDWYPDRSTRLWRRGKAVWGQGNLHEKLQVDGATGRLECDLHHFSGEAINSRLAKLVRFSDDFVQHKGLAGPLPGISEMVLRPLWRFVRAYFLRRGFLDGWPGYYIAYHTAFATFVRYAKLREARRSTTSSPQATTRDAK